MPRKTQSYKKNKPDSDSESESDSDFTGNSDDDETVYTTETESSDKSDIDDLHKTLQSLFPSRYLKEKEKEKKKKKEKEEKKKRKEKEKEKEKRKEKEKKKKNKNKKRKSYSSTESDEEESAYEYDDEDEESFYEDMDDEEEDENEDVDIEDLEEEDQEEDGNNKKDFKITLTIGGKNALKPKPEVNDEYGTDDEKTFMREKYDPSVGLPLTTSCQSLIDSTASASSSSPKRKRAKKEVEADAMSDVVDIGDKYAEIIELKKVLLEKLRTKPNNKIVKKALKQCDRSIQKLIKNARSKNADAYEELLSHADAQETVDELGYFKHKLSNKEQLQTMSVLKSINEFMYVEKPYRLSLLQSNIPPKFKAIAIQRLNQLNMMEPGDSEYFKLKNWVDNFMRIPFNVYKNLTINITDGIDKCSEYVINAKKQLDTCVFGLQDAKMQIMQMVGQWISNPNSMGTAIAIHGPAGTGKTSLVKDGISKILGREFAFIALGGCGDSSFLEGHSYTYEGSIWGKIVQILMECKCMNPVIYFDELDKVSDTARGQEIIGILTHLTDTTQNSQFHDKYFSEIDLDLSKCLFIFSYNDEKLVNPILKDRMYRIVTKGYELKEKITIARNYMLPKIREQVGFGPDEIVISDDVLGHIISNQAKGEEGVRNLKRTLEIIHTKLNLYRLITPADTGLFEKDMGLKVTFPHVLTKKDVDILVKQTECMNQSVLYNMYI